MTKTPGAHVTLDNRGIITGVAVAGLNLPKDAAVTDVRLNATHEPFGTVAVEFMVDKITVEDGPQ